jgi:anti-sigma-K factor RskA
VTADARSGAADDCALDAGAYLLGALDGGEAEAFRRHLAGCTVCREEVAALRSAADALALAAPQVAVPRALKRRVMAAVRASAQDAEVRPAGRRSPARMPARRLALAGAGSLAILATLIAVAVLAGGGSKSTRNLQASVAVPSASASLRVSSGHGELELRRMPPAPAGHIYEVWLQRGHGPPQPTSVLFNVTSSGAAVVGVPGDLRRVRAVLVTAERLGGSLRPTRAPVIVARLS